MTAIFESIPCNAKFKKEAICYAWHKEYPFIAVSTANGVVSVYNEEVRYKTIWEL